MLWSEKWYFPRMAEWKNEIMHADMMEPCCIVKKIPKSTWKNHMEGHAHVVGSKWHEFEMGFTFNLGLD